jgi:folate-binding protein YgfZ
VTPPTPTSSSTDAYHALRNAAAVRVLARDLLSVSGPEALTYLQGQCSHDLATVPVGGSTESLLLSPQGKVDAYLRVSRTADEDFVLDMDSGIGPAAQARLERFRLRAKVEIAPLAWECVGIRGPDASAVVVAGADGPALTVPVVWPGLTGIDLLGPAPDGGPLAWVDDAVARADAGSWEAARIEAGIPLGGREITEATIAAEVGLVDRTVSFTKGCFTGQELVARLDARGSKVARRLCGVVGAPSGTGAGLPPVGATVLSGDRAHTVGALSSVAWSPGIGGWVALATLHRRVAPPEAVVLRWDDPSGTAVEATGEARPLPLVA